MSDIEPYDNDKNDFLKEFEALRPDLMYAEAWNENERAEAVEMLRPSKVKTGMLSSIPMICRGSACVFAESCPLLKKNLAPLNKPCPIEMSAVQQFFTNYVEELDVDTNRMVEVSLVRDLVDQEIQQMRKTWLLSQEHFIQENVAGVTPEGEVVTKKELHQAVDYEERILKRKEKLRNALLATREARAKSGQGRVDSAQAVADIIHQVRELDRRREKDLLKQIGMEEHDEYIEAEILDDDNDDDEG